MRFTLNSFLHGLQVGRGEHARGCGHDQIEVAMAGAVQLSVLPYRTLGESSTLFYKIYLPSG